MLHLRIANCRQAQAADVVTDRKRERERVRWKGNREGDLQVYRVCVSWHPWLNVAS